MLSLESQRGSALITTLLVVAVVVIFSSALIDRFHLWLNQVTWVVRSERMLSALEGIQAAAKVVLRKPLLSFWQQGPIYFQGMKLYGRLDDQQGKFNVNDLVQADQQWRWVQLLNGLNVNIKSQEALEIAKQITQKLLTHQSPSLFLNISEIRDVPGMTAALYRRLKPYVTAIPFQRMQPINVNTASVPVLMTLAPFLNERKARALFICAKTEGTFLSLNDYNTRCLSPLLGMKLLPNTGVVSHYYVVNSQARLGFQEIHLRRLLYVRGTGDNMKASVLWQEIA